MSGIPFVDVQGLAGAWTLGTVQAGFELKARRSLPGGFGDISMEANRALVGDGWLQQTGTEETWDSVHGVGYVCGTPPCSGFSLLNTSKSKNSRGAGSAINSCMKDLVKYSSRCTGLDGKPGPEVVSFESVQGAFSQGRELMQELRAILEERTGQAYDLTHVLMSGSSVGGAQMRHRYYFVAHRIPFYIETPQPKYVVTYEDAIGDLAGAPTQWEPQPYPTDGPSDWALDKWRSDGMFDCHQHAVTGAFPKLVTELAPYWGEGEDIHEAIRRLGRKPDAIKPQRYVGADQKYPITGWSWPRRIDRRKPGYVLTGAGILGFVHYSEDRLLTVREAARLMGYPDAWRWDYASSPMQASMLIGKCCPVQSGRWISSWVANAIHGAYNVVPEYMRGNRGDVEEIGEREYKHNSTQAYKATLKRQLAEEQELVGV